MADVTKLKFENGTYDIKDTTARDEINNLDQKIDTNTNQLDQKIDTNTNQLESEIINLDTQLVQNTQQIAESEDRITEIENKAIFTFILDDGFKGDFINANPAFETYGWTFNSAISPQRLYNERNNGVCESRLAPYLRHQREKNMSMLAHGLVHADMRSVVNENLVISEIIQGKKALEEIGFKVCGFVPPFSTVNANYAHYLKENYSYAFNSYRSNITTMKNSGYKCIHSAQDDYYSLFRISLDDSVNSLQEILDLIDEAIISKGFICFYDHNIGNEGMPGTNSSVEKLEAILVHINTYYQQGKCEVLPTDEAVTRFFGINANYKGVSNINNNNMCVGFTKNLSTGTNQKDLWYIPSPFTVVNDNKLTLDIATPVMANTEYQIYCNVDISTIDLTDIRNHINVSIEGQANTSDTTQDFQISIEGRYLTSNTGSIEKFKLWREKGIYTLSSFPVNPVDNNDQILRAIIKITVLKDTPRLNVILTNPLITTKNYIVYK